MDGGNLQIFDELDFDSFLNKSSLSQLRPDFHNELHNHLFSCLNEFDFISGDTLIDVPFIFNVNEEFFANRFQESFRFFRSKERSELALRLLRDLPDEKWFISSCTVIVGAKGFPKISIEKIGFEFGD